MGTTLLTLRGRLQDILGDTNLIYADKYTDAINNAIREIFPTLYEALDDKTLITGNILPNAHFEDWAISSGATAVPDFYTLSNASDAVVPTTTAGLYWGGGKSVKFTPNGADGYLYITSNNYPALLDLMDCQISFRAWAYPQTINDAFLTIYTLKADGTAQTLNSTTACPAGKWTLLELKDQELNDDLVLIQFRFRVHTAGQYAYFDNARVTGLGQYEFLLPTNFRLGKIDEAYIQSSGLAEYPCDDLSPRIWDRVYGTEIKDDGTYKYLRLPALYSDNYQIRLIGRKPLDILTADTDTINISEEGQIQLLLRYAAYLIYEMQADGARSEDIAIYERASAKQLAKYYELVRVHAMPPSHKCIDRRLV